MCGPCHDQPDGRVGAPQPTFERSQLLRPGALDVAIHLDTCGLPEDIFCHADHAGTVGVALGVEGRLHQRACRTHVGDLAGLVVLQRASHLQARPGAAPESRQRGQLTEMSKQWAGYDFLPPAKLIGGERLNRLVERLVGRECGKPVTQARGQVAHRTQRNRAHARRPREQGYRAEQPALDAKGLVGEPLDGDAICGPVGPRALLLDQLQGMRGDGVQCHQACGE